MASAALTLNGAPAMSATPPNGSLLIVNKNSGMCVDVPGGVGTAGLAMQQSICDAAPSERWLMSASGAGYKIVSALTGRCLDTAGASKANKVAIVQAACGAGQTQVWTLQDTEAGVQVVNRGSGKCLNVANRSTDPGGPLQQFACQDSAVENHNDKWKLSPEGPPSSWSALVDVGLVPAAVANMPDGRLLLWSARDPFSFGGDRRTTYMATYDPATGSIVRNAVSNTAHDMFCPGTTLLPDGRLLVNGGSSSSKTSIFDPVTETWSTSAQMSIPRGYQGNTLLSDGDVLTLGGSWSGGIGGIDGAPFKDGEVWSADGGWRRLPDVQATRFPATDPQGTYRNDNHFWLYGVADGWVFHAGPSVDMHWIDTKGAGQVIDAGPRGDDGFSMNGSAAMVAPGHILTMGGAGAYKNFPGSDAVHLIDISGGPTAAASVRKLAPMTFPRTFNNAVVLPNGQVIVVGGQKLAKAFTDDRPIMIPEIWSPATETFERLAPMAVPRTYHSVALLMLDGRVFVGGGGLCGDCETNHPDFEILTPPYLLDAAGNPAARPSIVAAPSQAVHGGAIVAQTDRPVASFALVRLSAATHSLNNDQRRIPLTPVTTAGLTYTLAVPADTGTVLPGQYMLFALDPQGVPSVAKVVTIRPAAS